MRVARYFSHAVAHEDHAVIVFDTAAHSIGNADTRRHAGYDAGGNLLVAQDGIERGVGEHSTLVLALESSGKGWQVGVVLPGVARQNQPVITGWRRPLDGHMNPGSRVPSPSAAHSLAVRTAKTPGIRAAASVSMERMRAWACGEYTKTAYVWRANSM